MCSEDRWRQAYEVIESAIPGVVVESMGGACPFQGDGYVREGVYGGLRWYVRYRHDEATLYVYVPSQETDPEGWGYLNFDQTVYYSELIDAMGVYDGGSLEPPDAVALFIRLWERLRPIDQWQSTGQSRLRHDIETLTAALESGELRWVESTSGPVTIVSLEAGETP